MTQTDSTPNGALTILVVDKFETAGLETLRGLGYRVESQPDLGPDTIAAAVDEIDPHVIIVRSTKIPAPSFIAARRLSLIVRAGAGYDNIDVAAASARGIFVANCPGRNALAVAELAFGLILACDRRIPDQVQRLRDGGWGKKEFAKGPMGLAGRTLGVLGLGTIGRSIIDRGRGFGMEIAAWSRSLTPDAAARAGYHYCATPLEVAQQADVVSISVASTPETRHLVDAKFIAALHDDAILINTSRGAVIDEAALLTAVQSRGLRVGLDVYENQPGPSDTTYDGAIGQQPTVYGTHHNGASTQQAQDAIAAETVRIIATYSDSGDVPNCINLRQTAPEHHQLTVRHMNRRGVLAHIFSELRACGLNVEEMENRIYQGDLAACVRIRIDGAPSAEHLSEIANHEHVLSVDLAATD